jgi:hypothetical protein
MWSSDGIAYVPSSSHRLTTTVDEWPETSNFELASKAVVVSPNDETILRNCPPVSNRDGSRRSDPRVVWRGASEYRRGERHRRIRDLCGSCGAANTPREDQCWSCAAVLLQTCPRCDQTFGIEEAECPGCGLERDDFYTESARVAQQREQTRRRDVLAGQMVNLGFVALFLLTALWQHAEGVPSRRNVAIIMAMIYLSFWVLVRVIR